jgi:hypothetical protein
MDNIEIYKRVKFLLETTYNNEECKLSKRQNISDFVIFVEPQI